MTEALTKVHHCGIRVVALVMDGDGKNRALVNELGGCIKYPDIRPYFPHPVNTQQLVYIFFDICHCLKLVRNSFKTLGCIVSWDGVGQIKWEFLVEMQNLQKSEGLRAANKINESHINFGSKIMNVRLAAQLLSKSVACSLKYLRSIQNSTFENSQATEEFILLINNLFDIFNSKTPIGKDFKGPLTLSLWQNSVLPYLDSAYLKISALKTTSGPLMSDRKHLGFTGFLCAIVSLKGLMNELVINGGMRYLLLYKFSQDHLELFFNCIRRGGGWNNNPTAKQFIASFKTLLIKSGINPSKTGNSIAQDNTVIETLDHPFITSSSDNCFYEHNYADTNSLNTYITGILEYISGFVVKNLKKIIKCDNCIKILQANEAYAYEGGLLSIKNNGGLVIPAAGVVTVVATAEKHLRGFMKEGKGFWGMHLEMAVLADIPSDIFRHDHFKESHNGIENHYHTLVRKITSEFLKVRRHHIANTVNWSIKENSCRQKNNKTVLFKNL